MPPAEPKVDDDVPSDSRGRPRRGTPEQVAQAAHMRAKRDEKRAVKQAEELQLVRDTVAQVKAAKAAGVTNGR